MFTHTFIHIPIHIYTFTHTYINSYICTFTHNSILGEEEDRGRGGGGGGGGGMGVPLALVLYSMHATICYSIAQHMFSYGVSEPPIPLLLVSINN